MERKSSFQKRLDDLCDFKSRFKFLQLPLEKTSEYISIIIYPVSVVQFHKELIELKTNYPTKRTQCSWNLRDKYMDSRATLKFLAIVSQQCFLSPLTL